VRGVAGLFLTGLVWRSVFRLIAAA
jgi:hypothetical protein